MPDTGTSPNQTYSRSDGVRSGSTICQQESAAATGIQPNLVDAWENDMATAVNNRLMRNGGNQMTTNLPMGGFNLTNAGAGSAGNQVPNIAQIQNNGLIWGGTAGGTANALTFTLTPALAAYVTGQRFEFIGGASANTGAATGNFGPSAPTFKKQGNGITLADLEANDIMTGIRYVCAYDGTFLQLENPSGVLIGGRPENDTTEREYRRITSGSGAGATYSRRLLGSGANAVATLREYINNTKVLEWTSSLFTIVQAALFSSYADLTSIATPSAPGGGFTRLYSKTGDTLAMINGAGSEIIISPVALASAQGLVITNGTVPNTNISVSVTQAILTTAAGVPIRSGSVSNLICDLGLTSGSPNRLDTGSLAAHTWYYVYLISNGTTTATLASISSTSPTLPSGYTYFMRIGAMQTDGSSNLYRTIQKGNKARYQITGTTNTSSFPFTFSSSAGSWVSWTVTGNGAGAPSTATSGNFGLANSDTTGELLGIAPNGSYANLAVTTVFSNPAPLGIQVEVNLVFTTYVEYVLESSAIFYFSNVAAPYSWVMGWTDSVYAN